jgi:DNA-binding XRE family transcriptional regulator
MKQKYRGLNLQMTGIKIWDAMEKKGLKPDDIKDQLGLTKQAIYKWRWGQTSPRLEHIVILSQLLDERIEDLLCLD